MTGAAFRLALLSVAGALPATRAYGHDPTGIAVAPGGRILVADPYRCRIFEVAPDGAVVHFAGAAAGRGSVDGARLEACFGDPHGLAIGPNGEVLVGDYATGRIRRIGLDGQVATLAGSGDGFRDGAGAQAQFDGIAGLAVDRAGAVFVADARNHRIRRVAPDGTVSTVAGGERGYRDGPSTDARFDQPIGLAFDPEGVLLVADSGNHAVRRVSSDGTTSTLAGTPTAESRPAGAGAARLVSPWAVTAGPNGSVFVADVESTWLGRIDATGVLAFPEFVSMPGSPKSGPAPDRARRPLDRPCGIAFDAEGNGWVLDHFTGPALVLSRLSPNGTLTTLVNFDGQPGGR